MLCDHVSMHVITRLYATDWFGSCKTEKCKFTYLR